MADVHSNPTSPVQHFLHEDASQIRAKGQRPRKTKAGNAGHPPDMLSLELLAEELLVEAELDFTTEEVCSASQASIIYIPDFGIYTIGEVELADRNLAVGSIYSFIQAIRAATGQPLSNLVPEKGISRGMQGTYHGMSIPP